MMVEIISALESIAKGVFLVLVNASLQVTLLIFLVWFMIRIFRPKSAVARYYLWFLAVFGAVVSLGCRKLRAILMLFVVPILWFVFLYMLFQYFGFM